MSTVVARRVVATPARQASEAWGKIVELIAPKKDSEARKELESVTGIARSLIGDEAFKDAAAVVYGSGTRVRFYCLYNDDAISEDKKNENSLTFTATDGDWSMSLPCPVDDLTWVQAALKEKSNRITARDLATKVEDEKEENSESEDSSATVTVNREAFFNS